MLEFNVVTLWPEKATLLNAYHLPKTIWGMVGREVGGVSVSHSILCSK